jgi:hypothetical protein
VIGVVGGVCGRIEANDGEVFSKDETKEGDA